MKLGNDTSNLFWIILVILIAVVLGFIFFKLSSKVEDKIITKNHP
jgi:hypothetical protein